MRLALAFGLVAATLGAGCDDSKSTGKDMAIAPDLSAQDCSPKTFNVVNQGFSAFLINGTPNPPLTLCRGTTYTFNFNNVGHPFDIKTVQGNGTANRYNDGVSGQGMTTGSMTFAVSTSAPDTLFYNCEVHNVMTNKITVVSP